MKDITIHITPHGIQLRPSVRNFVERKISGLSRVAGDMVGAEIVLRGKRGAASLFSASARVALPGRDLQGNATHASLYGAIDQLVSRLARLARKRKTRMISAFRRPGKKRQRLHRAWSALNP